MILDALKAALEPLDYVYAMWEGGAAAFGRVDEWSDIDVQFDVADERVEDTFAVVGKTLEALSPIELQHRTSSLPWPGIFQIFYRLKQASPYLLVDTAVIQHSAPDKLLAPEMHGQAVFHFDKAGVADVPPSDAEAQQKRLTARLEVLRVTFPLFQVMVTKELERGNSLEALAFYNASTLRPLVEVLRIRYQPGRSSFHTRYVYTDLPAEVAQRLEALFFVRDAEDIRQKHALAEQWFNEELAGFSAASRRATGWASSANNSRM
jgi:hypothetical protein